MPKQWSEQTMEIRVAIRVREDSPAEAWAIADNVDISMRNACDEVAKQFMDPDSGLDVIVS